MTLIKHFTTLVFYDFLVKALTNLIKNYKKRVVVQNKSYLLLKIFCKTFKHYN
jgi:hypothetical protein